MKNFKSFINEAGPNAKPKAKGEADFVDAHKVEISDPEEQGTDGSAKVTTKEGSGKRKADRLDNKQAMGEEVEELDELSNKKLNRYVDKAHDSIQKLSQKRDDLQWQHDNVKDIDKEKHKKRIADIDRKLKNRERGMDSADHDRLRKEEVELDEAKLDLDKEIANHKKAGAAHMDKFRRRPGGANEPHYLAHSNTNFVLANHHASAAHYLQLYKETGDKKHLNRYKSTKKQMLLYPTNEQVKLDEISLGLAKKAYQKRAQKAYDTEDDKEINKQSAQSGRIIKKFGKAGHKAVDSVHRKFDNYKEEVELDEEQLIEMDKSEMPFTPNKPKKNPPAKAGKYGQGPSTAKHLAQMALKKQLEKMKEEVEEVDEAAYTNPGLEALAKKKKSLRQMKQGMKEADFSKQQTKMAHTIGKEFEKKGVGDQYKGGPYAVASAMVRDKPESAKKAYKTIQSKMKEEADTELLFKLYNDLNEENQEFFMHQLEEDAESLLDFAKMLEE